MILVVAIIGVLFCVALAGLFTIPVAFKYNRTWVVPVMMVLWLVLSGIFVSVYKTVIHEYFVGQEITYKTVCEEVKQVRLYWK